MANSDFSNNVENDTKKAMHAAREGKNAAKQTYRTAKKTAKVAKKTAQTANKVLAVLPPHVKIAIGIVLAILLAISVLVGGTGGIYSNENTHIYSNKHDKNYPIPLEMSNNEQKKDTYKKDDAIKSMSKYISVIHEIIEEEKDNDINDTINKAINKNNWDKDETYAQKDDQSDFSEGITISGDDDEENGDSLSGSGDGAYIVKKAREYIGPKYVHGGEKIGRHGRNAADCSGFTKSLYKKYANVTLPRGAVEQGNAGKTIGTSKKALKKAQPGDLIIYGRGSAHVGIFSKKKKGKYYQIHCTVGWGKTGVMETPLHRANDITKIVRVLKPSSSSSVLNDAADWKKLGKNKITHFCPMCNSPKGSYQSSSGKKLSKGDVACSEFLRGKNGKKVKIPIGTVLKVKKKCYKVVDRPAAKIGIIDVFRDTPKKCSCNKAGSYKAKVQFSGNTDIEISDDGKIEDTAKTGFTTKLKKSVKIPKSIRQTGITDDFTAYYRRHIDPDDPKYKGTWHWYDGGPENKLAKTWLKKGAKSDRKIATLNGFYLVAVTAKFGNVGDAISIHLKGGKKINCIIADQKRSHGDGGTATPWGHKKEHGLISLVEWESVGYGDDLSGWKGKHVTKIENYGKYNGVDMNGVDGYGESLDTEITVEDLKILSAYSVSLANLQIYEQEGKVKRVASSSVGYRVSDNKTYKLVDENGDKIDAIVNKYGVIEFEKDLKDKLKRYIDDCHDNNETAFFDVSFQKDSSGNTTHTKTETIELKVKGKNGKSETKTIEKTIRYGVPIIKNKNIADICAPMFKVEPDDKYVNGPSITNADAIINMTKNTIAVYFDGDPNQVDGESEAIEGELQNAYEWPAPNSKSKKKYKLINNKKTLVFKGKEGDPVVSIAKGVIKSVTVDKESMQKKVNVTEDNKINMDIQSSVKSETPKIVVISHEKGKILSIYKGVMISGGITAKAKVGKGKQIGTFCKTGKLVFQVKVNKKFVNPLQFLKSYGTGKLIWPAKKGWTFGRGWGVWSTLGDQSAHIHQGIDITAPGGIGAPVLAMDNGIVVTPVKWVSCRGWYLVIKHNNKLYSLYQHLSSTSKGMVKRGQIVKKGQKIAEQGGSFKTKGNDCSTHIHFEVYPKYPVRGGRIPWETANRGETYDPLKFLPKSKKVPSSYSKNIGKIKKFEHH